MAEIDVRDEGGKTVFVVKYEVVSGPHPIDHFPEYARLRLAFRHNPGSALGQSRQVGEFDYGQLEGAINYFECSVEPYPANAAALMATGFPWTPTAAARAASCRVDPAEVARVRADVDAIHRELVRTKERCLERLFAGDASEEILRALREAGEILRG